MTDTPIVLFVCINNAGRSQAVPQLMTSAQVRDSDVVITMGCGDPCPIFPGNRDEDRELSDPRGKTTDEVRPIRDDSRARIERLLAQLAATRV